MIIIYEIDRGVMNSQNFYSKQENQLNAQRVLEFYQQVLKEFIVKL